MGGYSPTMRNSNAAFLQNNDSIAKSQMANYKTSVASTAALVGKGSIVDPPSIKKVNVYENQQEVYIEEMDA